MTKVKVTIMSDVKLGLKSDLNNNKKTTQTNLKKLDRKIKHSLKVFHILKLGSHIQGQGHNQGSEVKCLLKDSCPICIN